MTICNRAFGFVILWLGLVNVKVYILPQGTPMNLTGRIPSKVLIPLCEPPDARTALRSTALALKKEG